MDQESSRSVGPLIAEAQEALMRALEAACQVDVSKADTGELIRVEEALQTASKAAKDVVSLRLRRRAELEKKLDAPVRADGPEGTAAPQPPGEHRVVADETGTQWDVVAVYPSSRSVDKRTLPEKFAQGWLLFQHGDEVRRHAPVPEKWSELSDADLRFLCQNAEAATRRITTAQR